MGEASGCSSPPPHPPQAEPGQPGRLSREKDPLLYHPHRPEGALGKAFPWCSDTEMLAGV